MSDNNCYRSRESETRNPARLTGRSSLHTAYRILPSLEDVLAGVAGVTLLWVLVWLAEVLR